MRRVLIAALCLWRSAAALNANVRDNSALYGKRGEQLAAENSTLFAFENGIKLAVSGRNLAGQQESKRAMVGPATLYEFMMNEEVMFDHNEPYLTKDGGATFNITVSFKRVHLKLPALNQVLREAGGIGLPQADHPMCNHPMLRCNPGPCTILEMNYNNLDLVVGPVGPEEGDNYDFTLTQYGLTNCGPVFGRAVNLSYVTGRPWSVEDAKSIGDESFYHAAVSIPGTVQPSGNLPDAHRYSGERAFRSTFGGLAGKGAQTKTEQDRTQTSVRADPVNVLQTVWRPLDASSSTSIAQNSATINVPMSIVNAQYTGTAQASCKYRVTVEASGFVAAGLVPDDNGLPSISDGQKQQWVDYVCDTVFGDPARAPYVTNGLTLYAWAREQGVPLNSSEAFNDYALNNASTDGWSDNATLALEALNELAWSHNAVALASNGTIEVDDVYIFMAACCTESSATYLPDLTRACDYEVEAPPEGEATANNFGTPVPLGDAERIHDADTHLLLAKRGQTCAEACVDFGSCTPTVNPTDTDFTQLEYFEYHVKQECGGAGQSFDKTPGFPYVYFDPVTPANVTRPMQGKCVMHNTAATSNAQTNCSWQPPNPEDSRVLCRCASPPPCLDVTKVVHAATAVLRKCCPWSGYEADNLDSSAASPGAGRCLVAPGPPGEDDCALDTLGVRPGGFTNSDYDWWNGKDTTELKMTYHDIGPDSKNVQAAKGMDWVPDAALLQRRLRAASDDDWAAFVFDAPMLPVLGGISNDVTAMTLPFLKRGTSWVPDWARPSKTNGGQGPYGSARGASFMMDQPYMDNNMAPPAQESLLWNRDCYGCTDDDKLYNDTCAKAQTVGSDGKFPEAGDEYAEATASADARLSCSAMGWGCYDEMYRCNIHNIQKGTIVQEGNPADMEERDYWFFQDWPTGSSHYLAKGWSTDMAGERTSTTMEPNGDPKVSLKGSHPVCPFSWCEEVNKHKNVCEHKNSGGECTTDTHSIPGWGWQLHRSVYAEISEADTAQRKLHADPDVATYAYRNTAQGAPNNAVMCPAFRNNGFESLFAGEACLACWDGLADNVVGEHGWREITTDLNKFRENHGLPPEWDSDDIDSAKVWAQQGLVGANGDALGAVDAVLGNFPGQGSNTFDGFNSWIPMTSATNWLSFAAPFQSQTAHYWDHVGERCESARSMYYDQNRAPWQSVGVGQETYGTGCGRRASGGNNWDPFVSMRGMPAATMQLLNWAKYGCLKDTQCKADSLPPWGRKTFFDAAHPEREALALASARCWYTKVPPPECNDGRFNRTDFDSTLYNAADWSAAGDATGNRPVTGDASESITERLRHNVRAERGDTANPWARMDNVSRRWVSNGLTVLTKENPSSTIDTFEGRHGCTGYLIQPSHYFDDGKQDGVGRYTKHKQPFVLTLSLGSGACTNVDLASFSNKDLGVTNSDNPSTVRWVEYAFDNGTYGWGNTVQKDQDLKDAHIGGRAFFNPGPCAQYAKRRGVLKRTDTVNGAALMKLTIDNGCGLPSLPTATVEFAGCETKSVRIKPSGGEELKFRQPVTWKRGAAVTGVPAMQDAVWNDDWLGDVLDPLAPRKLAMPIDPNLHTTCQKPETKINILALDDTDMYVKKTNEAELCTPCRADSECKDYDKGVMCYQPKHRAHWEAVPGCVFPDGFGKSSWWQPITDFYTLNIGYCYYSPPALLGTATWDPSNTPKMDFLYKYASVTGLAAACDSESDPTDCQNDFQGGDSCFFGDITALDKTEMMVPGCAWSYFRRAYQGGVSQSNIIYNQTAQTGPNAGRFEWHPQVGKAIPLVLRAGAVVTCTATGTSHVVAVDFKRVSTLWPDFEASAFEVNEGQGASGVQHWNTQWIEYVHQVYNSSTKTYVMDGQIKSLMGVNPGVNSTAGVYTMEPELILDVGPQAYGRHVYCPPVLPDAFALTDGNAPFPAAITEIEVIHCVTTGAPRMGINVIPADLHGGIPADYPQRPYFQNSHSEVNSFACDCMGATPQYGCLRYESSAEATMTRMGITPPAGMELLECGWSWDNPVPPGLPPVGLYVPSRQTPFHVLERDPFTPASDHSDDINKARTWATETWASKEGPSTEYLHKLQADVSQNPVGNDFDINNNVSTAQRMLHRFVGSCIRPPYGRLHRGQLEADLLRKFYISGTLQNPTLTPLADEALYGYCEGLVDNLDEGQDPQYQFCANDPFSPEQRHKWCHDHSDSANFILVSMGIGPRTERSACNHDTRVCVLLPGDPGDYGTLPKLLKAMAAGETGYTVVVAPFSYTLALTLRADTAKYNMAQPKIASTDPFHSVAQATATSTAGPDADEAALYIDTPTLRVLADLGGLDFANATESVVVAALERMQAALLYYNSSSHSAEYRAECTPTAAGPTVPAPSLKPAKTRGAVPRPWACVPEAEFEPVLADSVVITQPGFRLVTTPGTGGTPRAIRLGGRTDPAIVIKAADVHIGPVHRDAGSAVAAYGPTAANLVLERVTVAAVRPGTAMAPVALLGERYIDVTNVDITVDAPPAIYAVAVAGAYLAGTGIATLTAAGSTPSVSVLAQGTDVPAVFVAGGTGNPLNVTDLTALIAEIGIEKERRIFTHAPTHDVTLAILASCLTLAAGILTLNIAVVRRIPTD